MQREWKGLPERGLTACAQSALRLDHKAELRTRSLESRRSATRVPAEGALAPKEGKRAIVIDIASVWNKNPVSATDA